MDTEADLKYKSEIADAELGVAEELGWGLSICAALAVYFKWESWLMALAIFAAAYAITIYRYRRKASFAEDVYFKAAGLGKYARDVGNLEEN